MKASFPKPAQKGLKGQSIVEFGLVLPIFLLLIFGMMDLSRFYYTQQGISHTLRAAGRYAVTGQLADNPSYDPDEEDSLAYLNRRQSIIEAAKSNNPIGLPIDADGNSNAAGDSLKIMSSDNFDGPWELDSSTGIGGQFIRLEYETEFNFLTPFMTYMAEFLTGENPFTVEGAIIMKNEPFRTNEYPNDTYWN